MFEPCLAELGGKKGFALPEEAGRIREKRLTSRPGPQWGKLRRERKGAELKVVQQL